jgi:hypothetical protein
MCARTALAWLVRNPVKITKKGSWDVRCRDRLADFFFAFFVPGRFPRSTGYLFYNRILATRTDLWVLLAPVEVSRFFSLTCTKMRVAFPSIDWNRITERDRDKDSYALLTRTLLRGTRPLPWKRVQVDIDSNLDRRWLAKCSAFVVSLSRAEILTLYVYTSPSFCAVQDLLRGGTEYESLVFPADVSTCDAHGYRRNGAVLVWKRHGTGDVPPHVATRVKAHFEADKDFGSAEEYSAWYERWDDVIRLARPFLNARFWARARAALVREHWRWNCHFAHAARCLRRKHVRSHHGRVPREPLARFRALLPHVKPEGWRAIMLQFAADLDAIFTKAPALRSSLTVFRGVDGRRSSISRRSDGAFTSTSLRREIAEGFTNKTEKCCLVEMTLEPGARVLPMFMVSRYPVEMEVLLNRPRPGPDSPARRERYGAHSARTLEEA